MIILSHQNTSNVLVLVEKKHISYVPILIMDFGIELYLIFSHQLHGQNIKSITV